MKSGTKFTYGKGKFGQSRYVFERLDGANWICHPVEAMHQTFAFTPEHQVEAHSFEEPPASTVTGLSNFNRENLKALRLAINAAVEKVGQQFGIKVEAGSCSFMDQTASFKLQCSVIGESGEVADPRAAALKIYGPMEGLRPEHLEPAFRFRLGGKVARLVGYNARAKNMPYIIQYEGEVGKRKCTRDYLVAPLGLK